MISRNADGSILAYALKLARDTGSVMTSDIVDRFGISTMNASSHLSHIRRLGLLDASGTESHGRIVNKITDAGLARIGGGDRPRVFDCAALCVAFGYPA